MTDDEIVLVVMIGFGACALLLIIAVYAWYTSAAGPAMSRPPQHEATPGRRPHPIDCPSCHTALSGRVLRCSGCGYDIYKRNWKATLAPWLVPVAGIVLAHMARSDFKLNPYWRGQTAAVVALALGYGLLALPVLGCLGYVFVQWMSGAYS